MLPDPPGYTRIQRFLQNVTSHPKVAFIFRIHPSVLLGTHQPPQKLDLSIGSIQTQRFSWNAATCSKVYLSDPPASTVLLETHQPARRLDLPFGSTRIQSSLPNVTSHPKVAFTFRIHPDRTFFSERTNPPEGWISY